MYTQSVLNSKYAKLLFLNCYIAVECRRAFHRSPYAASTTMHESRDLGMHSIPYSFPKTISGSNSGDQLVVPDCFRLSFESRPSIFGTSTAVYKRTMTLRERVVLTTSYGRYFFCVRLLDTDTPKKE